VHAAAEYLISYGKSGDFGRFAATEPLACQRGDCLIVETNRGLEFGQVIRRADPEHARLMGGGPAGRIVRQPSSADLHARSQLHERGQQLFRDARARAGSLRLPMEIVDAEILLEGRQAILHVLRWGDSDLRQLTDELVRTHGLLTLIHDLALPAAKEEPQLAEDHGCGSGGCGSGGCGTGGCSSGGCGTCSSGGCSSSKHTHELTTPRPQSISLL
jgi:hypothetical protein